MTQSKILKRLHGDHRKSVMTDEEQYNDRKPFDWENNEGIDPGIIEPDVHEGGYTFPSRNRYSHIDILGYKLMSIENNQKLLVTIIKKLCLNFMILLPQILSIYVHYKYKGHYITEYWPGTYSVWRYKIFPVSVYFQLWIIVLHFRKIIFIILMDYVRNHPIYHSNPINRGGLKKLVMSNGCQVMILASNSILLVICSTVMLFIFYKLFIGEVILFEIQERHPLVYCLFVFNILFIFGSILVMFENIVMLKVFGEFYKTIYASRLQDYFFSFQAVNKLYTHSLGLLYNHKRCVRDNKKHHKMFSILEVSNELLSSELNYIQFDYLVSEVSCNDGMLGTSSASKNIARTIFRHFSNKSNESPYDEYCIELETLYTLFNKEDSRRIFSLMDINNDGFVTKSDIKTYMVLLYKEKIAIAKSVRSHGLSLLKLHHTCMSFCMGLVFIMIPLLFGFPARRFFTGISGITLGFSFMFGQSSTVLFNSLIFLFVTHPFDIDDKVYIMGRVYIVQEIGLLCTILRTWDKKIIYYPNNLLYDMDIINIRRSSNMAEWIEIGIDQSTSIEKIDALDKGTREFLARSKYFEHGQYQEVLQKSLTIYHLESIDCKLWKIGIILKHSANFQDGFMRATRHYSFMKFIKEISTNLGLKFYPLTKSVGMVDGWTENTVIC